MKIILLLIMGYSVLVQIIDSKKYRGIMYDEVLDYHPDKNVPSIKTYFSFDHLILEQVGDDQFLMGGYIECIKSMNRNLPIKATVQTRYYQYSKWNEGPFRLNQVDVCKDFRDASRFWHNVTRLITLDVCPPQKGDKWFIENQTLTTVVDLPPMQLVPWRGYIKHFQGTAGHETDSYGMGVEVELILE